MPSDVTLAPARSDDVDAAIALLARCGLPAEGLAAQFPTAYVVARRDRRLIGLAGLERYGRDALLRSVAVDPDERGTGVGRALVADRLRAAEAHDVTAVCLLTTTAAAWFGRFGFVARPRHEAPAAIAASVEFATVCCRSATCMMLSGRSARTASPVEQRTPVARDSDAPSQE